MATTMRGSIELPASKALVWAKLNDPVLMRLCIPGCQSLDKTSDTSFVATAKVRIGLLSATFKGNIALTNLDPPNGYRIVAEGAGGIAGFATGGADVTLSAIQGGTLLSYDVQAQVGGRIAQLGSRLTGGVAKKTADAFFARFAAALASAEADAS